jgi:hypothetical protein
MLSQMTAACLKNIQHDVIRQKTGQKRCFSESASVAFAEKHLRFAAVCAIM